MPQLFTVEEDVLSSASMEMTRMFDVLSNSFSNARFAEHSLFLTKIEKQLTFCLKNIKQNDIAPLITT